MRIGVDATCWANERGYGRFTREVVTAMAARAPGDELVCFLDPAAAAVFQLGGPNVRKVVVGQGRSQVHAASTDGYRSPFDVFRLSRAVRHERPDVFFFPAQYTYYPLPPGLPAVITFHDTIADRFPELTLPGWRARLFWRIKTRLALLQADLVLTVSEYAAGELVQVLGVSRDRIRVAGEAPAAAYRPSAAPEEVAAAAARAGLPPGARWFVYVGGFNPHKHVDLIVRAHAQLVRSSLEPPPHLLLVGATTGDAFFGSQPAIREAIAAAGTTALVHWPGRLPDEELRHLHAGAIALVLPSASEGFGLPAVEAAACGTPVVATRESPLPALLAGGGIFVPPGDVGALAAALRRLAEDPAERDRLGARALERARLLSWERGADAVLAALREVAA